MDILIADLVIIGCVIVFVIIGLRAMLNGAQRDAERITEARNRDYPGHAQEAKARASHPWPIIHRSGCNKVAFRLAQEPQAGEVPSSALAITYDGKPVEPYSPMACPHCGGLLVSLDLSTDAIKRAYAVEQAATS